MKPFSWKRASVLAVEADPLGGGESSASLDDGKSVVSDRLPPDRTPFSRRRKRIRADIGVLVGAVVEAVGASCRLGCAVTRERWRRLAGVR